MSVFHRVLPFILVPLAAASTGCHKRYQKHADQLGHVKVVVKTPGPAVVETGDADVEVENDVVEAAVEVAAEVATIVLATKAQKKLNKGTSAQETRDLMATGLLQSVDNAALPYKVGEKGRSRLIISIEDYGLDASTGVPTAFVNTRTTIMNTCTVKRTTCAVKRTTATVNRIIACAMIRFAPRMYCKQGTTCHCPPSVCRSVGLPPDC